MPANFPGSVTTFTSRNSGDVIQPSHINDLQDEVNAIEDGYVNATARLNSSNSTLANLVVTGGSTFRGGLQSSNSTVAGGLTSSNSTLANLSVSGESTFTRKLTMLASTFVGGSTVAANVGYSRFGAFVLSDTARAIVSTGDVGLYFVCSSGSQQYIHGFWSTTAFNVISAGTSAGSTRGEASKMNVYHSSNGLNVQHELGGTITAFVWAWTR